VGAINQFWVLWQLILVMHTLDVMHCEKNIGENILKVIFGENDSVAI
jgi:hypothetical protein